MSFVKTVHILTAKEQFCQVENMDNDGISRC